MLLNSIKKIISENSLDDIKLTGITSVEHGIAEFIPDMRYMYFEFGDSIIELESIEQYSKIKIKFVDSIIHEPDFEDVFPSSTNISRIVFTNYLTVNKVVIMTLFNFEEDENVIVCDAVQFNLQNEQVMFLDPQFIGINIGGEEQKKLWLDNLVEGVTVNETIIDFE